MIDACIEKLFQFHDRYPSKIGQLYLILVSLCTTGIFASSKLLTERHPLSVILYDVAILMTICIYFFSKKYNVKQLQNDKPEVQWKLFLRGFIGSSNWLIITGGAVQIPIQLIGVLVATNTFWGQFFDAFISGIKITKTMIILVITTFFGIVLVVNPEFMLGYFGVVYESSEEDPKSSLFYIGVFLALLGTFLSVYINWLIAGLSQSIHPLQNMFYFAVFCTWAAGFVRLISGGDVPWLPHEYLYLLIQFLSMIGLQNGLYFGNKLEKRLSYVAVLQNLNIVWNFAQAIQVWNDVIQISNIVGAAVVIFSGIFIMYKKESTKKLILKKEISETENVNIDASTAN